MNSYDNLRARLSIEDLEDRLPPASDLFVTPPADSPGGMVQLRFAWGAGEASFRNEIGIYAIDDAAGRVGGLLPTDAGYAAAALARGQVVFASGATVGAKNQLTVAGGQLLGLYIVGNSTTQMAQAGLARAFFTFDGANADGVDHAQTRARGDGGVNFHFEDTFGGGDFDYNDAVIAVSATYAIATPGQLGQTVQAQFTQVSRDASYQNEFGVFRVDGKDGSIGGVKPGDAGYLPAALGSSTRQAIFSDATMPDVTSRAVTLDAGALYGFYIVANGTAEQALGSNPANTPGAGPIAYFSFVEANPDGLDHFDWRSANEFGFEDSFGGGDQDFNEMVVQFSFGPPTGTPDPDANPPETTIALVNDSGSSNTDKVTNDERIIARIADASSVARLGAAFDNAAASNFVNVLPNLTSNGTLNLTTTLIAMINNGVALTDGNHTLFLDIADAAGNSDLRQFTFTLDRTAGSVAFNLDDQTDTGTNGDLRTGSATATLAGTAEAGSAVEVFEVSRTTGVETSRGTATAGAGGTFTITNVPLNVGSTVLRVRSTDAAGNTAASDQTITRTQGPAVTAGANLSRTATVGAGTNVDLRTIFDTLARFETSEGNIDITLFEETAPLTVANFLKYVNDTTANGGDYNNTIFHRLAKGFALQGGGFRFNDAADDFDAITKDPPVTNEFNLSNTRGTIAMAKLGTDVNSATNEFFFNLANNSANLDNQNGGFTVFGKVSDASLTVLDNIEQNFTEFSGADIPGAAPFPVRNGTNTTDFPDNVSPSQLAQLFRAVSLSDPLQFSFTAVSTNPAVATVNVTGTSMTITGVSAGTTAITLTATDPDGTASQVTFNVTVS